MKHSTFFKTPALYEWSLSVDHSEALRDNSPYNAPSQGTTLQMLSADFVILPGLSCTNVLCHSFRCCFLQSLSLITLRLFCFCLSLIVAVSKTERVMFVFHG